MPDPVCRGPRIVFYGTPDFAVSSLEALLKARYPLVGVVTAPDKPAGRGLHLTASPVKEAALRASLPLAQPTSLGDPSFLELLASWKPDLQIVVAFRKLPPPVWSYPSMGTINVHASLLPLYRGAAPIHHAILNGETMTGLTTFFINDRIDEGSVLLQQTVPIGPDETTGELYDRMKVLGGDLLIKTIEAVTTHQITPVEQHGLTNGVSPDQWKPAPKLTAADRIIHWDQPVAIVYNRIRALIPFPGPLTELPMQDGEPLSIRILRAAKVLFDEDRPLVVPGEIHTDRKHTLFIGAQGGMIELLRIQPAGKKPMSIKDFLHGYGAKLP